jgi:aspartate beta-hydroxylase
LKHDSDRLRSALPALQAILRRGADGSLSEFVREYEAKDFKGPSAIAVDSKGNIFFTDSGPMGESTLQAPLGSVFTVSRDGQLLQPLALETLAHPCGLALSPNDAALYVCEMMANRLLRFVQRPTGVWHCSAYHQFCGGLGPSAVACDAKGFLYVALYDFAVVRNQGAAAHTIASPGMSSAASSPRLCLAIHFSSI